MDNSRIPSSYWSRAPGEAAPSISIADLSTRQHDLHASKHDGPLRTRVRNSLSTQTWASNLRALAARFPCGPNTAKSTGGTSPASSFALSVSRRAISAGSRRSCPQWLSSEGFAPRRLRAQPIILQQQATPGLAKDFVDTLRQELGLTTGIEFAIDLAIQDCSCLSPC